MSSTTRVNNSKGEEDTKNYGCSGATEQQEHKNKNQQLEEYSEPIDSGFISGPQSEPQQEEKEKRQEEKSAQVGSGAGTTSTKKQLNIKLLESNDTVEQLDSGCIEEIELEEEEQLEKKQINSTQQQQQQQQTEQNKQTQMLLKENVDAGMAEWFCNLSLQNSATGTTVPELNNLNANKRINVHEKEEEEEVNDTSNTTNAWEKFYQQNDEGDTPLHLACIAGADDVVAALIRMAPHPCLFNIQNDDGQTPLHFAALTSQPKILRMLLIAGAEPTIRDRHGNTALHLSCMSGEAQCVHALTMKICASEINEAHRQYGHRSNDKTVSYLSCAQLPSDLEIRNYDGERCVHLAAQSGFIEILRILVLHKADINAREGKSGRTPLHIAIENCNEELVNFLLNDCELDLETETYAGLTAYQVACILNRSQLQQMLEKRGAQLLTPPDSDYDSDLDSDIEEPPMCLQVTQMAQANLC